MRLALAREEAKQDPIMLQTMAANLVANAHLRQPPREDGPSEEGGVPAPPAAVAFVAVPAEGPRRRPVMYYNMVERAPRPSPRREDRHNVPEGDDDDDEVRRNRPPPQLNARARSILYDEPTTSRNTSVETPD